MPNSATIRSLIHIVTLSLLLARCGDTAQNKEPVIPFDSAVVESGPPDPSDTPFFDPVLNEKTEIASFSISPDSLVAFSKTLIGTPYLYASTDPAKGFDCSGFITYVFNHFNCTVPRSSVDFTNYGKDVNVEDAKPGDLILFTGTDSTIRVVGHMGIIEHWQNDTVYFIHSSSGKNKGVVITPMGKYYQSRFVKVIRVFPDEAYQRLQD